MRKLLVPAALVALAAAASVVGQQSDQPREPAPSRDRQTRPFAPAAMPPGVMAETRIEAFLFRPGRVIVRDTWKLGRVECRPWQEGAGAPGAVRVNAVIAYADDRPDEKVAGVELVLEDEYEDRTFLFDAAQVPDVLIGMESAAAAADKLREPQIEVRRRAVYSINGLEIGMNPRRTGGYLAPVGPDERAIGMSPDNFGELKRLLDDAKATTTREGGK